MLEDHSTSNEGPSWAKKWPLTVLGVIVWLALATFGLYDIYLGRQIVVKLVVTLTNELPSATLVGNIVVLILALVWLWYVIVGGEVNLKRIQQRKGWIWFGAGAVVELLILILYLLV